MFKYPVYQHVLLFSVLFALTGCTNRHVILPRDFDDSPPDLEVIVNGTNIMVKYGDVSIENGVLRDDPSQLAEVSNRDPQRGSIVFIAKDPRSGVKKASISAIFKFTCRFNLEEHDHDFTKRDRSEDRRIDLPSPGDEVLRSRVTAVAFNIDQANEVCLRRSTLHGSSHVTAFITVEATNYFDVSVSKEYKVKFRFRMIDRFNPRD